MDPVSHCLLGHTIACLDGRGRLGRGATAAATLGAIAPDADILWMRRGWDVYLLHHEAGTHSLIWSPVVAIATALVVRSVVRDARLLRLWIAAWLGVALGHLGLDLISGSDMRLFAPLWSIRLGPHWFAMADLLLVAVIVAGAVVTRRRRTTGAVLTVALLAALVGVKAASQNRGAHLLAAAVDSGDADWIVGPLHAVNRSFSTWRAFGANGRSRRGWEMDAWTGRTATLFTRESTPVELVPDAAWRTPVARHFAVLAGIPIVTLEDRLVLWSHIRDCSATTCDLAFGVEIDERGRPLRQVVRFGPWSLWRALPPDDQSGDAGTAARRP